MRDLFSPPPDADPSFDRSRGSETSAAAWESKLADGSAETDRALILALVKAGGERGLTIDEASAKLERPPNAISGRFADLGKRRLIEKTTRTRLTRALRPAAVWIAR